MLFEGHNIIIKRVICSHCISSIDMLGVIKLYHPGPVMQYHLEFLMVKSMNILLTGGTT